MLMSSVAGELHRPAGPAATHLSCIRSLSPTCPSLTRAPLPDVGLSQTTSATRTGRPAKRSATPRGSSTLAACSTPPRPSGLVITVFENRLQPGQCTGAGIVAVTRPYTAPLTATDAPLASGELTGSTAGPGTKNATEEPVHRYGNCNHRKYLRHLFDLIVGVRQPAKTISRQIGLVFAVDAHAPSTGASRAG